MVISPVLLNFLRLKLPIISPFLDLTAQEVNHKNQGLGDSENGGIMELKILRFGRKKVEVGGFINYSIKRYF